MKRIISVLLLVVVFTSCTFKVSAATEEPVYADPITAHTVNTGDNSDVLAASSENVLKDYSADMLDLLMLRIRDAIVSYESGFSLAQYDITSTALSALCQEIWNLYPEVFLQTDCKIRWSYYPSTGKAAELKLQYLISEEDFKSKKDFYFSEIDRIISTVPNGISNLEKVVYINEYLTTNYSYDYNVGTSAAIHDAYGFLTEKRGVCQSYTLTFLALMRELNIECRYAYNDGHAWNVVNLDGKYYHVDATHDDPITYYYGDLAGRVSHDHLLVSTDTLLSCGGHSDWSTSPSYREEVVCDDTTYDNAFWNDVRTPLVHYNGEWYGISNDKMLFKTNSTFTSFTPIRNLDFSWPVKNKPGYSLMGYYSGLTIVGNMLYFNTPYSVVSYNIDTNTASTVQTFNCENNIYASYYKNGKIYCVTAYSPSDVPDSENIVCDIGMGDIDRNGTVTATDLLLVKKHLLGMKTQQNVSFGDVNHDNRIDVLDFIHIKKYVSGLISNVA